MDLGQSPRGLYELWKPVLRQFLRQCGISVAPPVPAVGVDGEIGDTFRDIAKHHEGIYRAAWVVPGRSASVLDAAPKVGSSLVLEPGFDLVEPVAYFERGILRLEGGDQGVEEKTIATQEVVVPEDLRGDRVRIDEQAIFVYTSPLSWLYLGLVIHPADSC